MTRVASAILLILFGAGLHAVAMQKPTPGGYIIEHDAEVAKNEPGTHNGGGQTVGLFVLQQGAEAGAGVS